MARVNEGSHSLPATRSPHVYPQIELAILSSLLSRRASPYFDR